MLAYYVEKHMREALAPMLFDDERGPVRDSPVAKAERSPQAKRKATAKRTNSGQDVHDFRGLLAQLGTLTMNRIKPSEPGKPRYRRSPCGSPSRSSVSSGRTAGID